MKTIGIIPARGGSKGIKEKNIVNLKGKPLIYYTIEAALKSSMINKIYISTEDKRIKEVCKNYGSNELEIISRPKILSSDSASLIDVILDIIRSNNGFLNNDIIVLLQPTSPLRTENDID
ncbi:MAG: acylneuraminate cytidylyltransferase family protein, partial [Candidatus Lokiarchaeota archaeon]|nr:acylneuraminate cytidylyltransferase family protein [Candidatus Lokiarchaeota archaeon]